MCKGELSWLSCFSSSFECCGGVILMVGEILVCKYFWHSWNGITKAILVFQGWPELEYFCQYIYRRCAYRSKLWPEQSRMNSLRSGWRSANNRTLGCQTWKWKLDFGACWEITCHMPLSLWTNRANLFPHAAENKLYLLQGKSIDNYSCWYTSHPLIMDSVGPYANAPHPHLSFEHWRCLLLLVLLLT
jgi:hypothetical protein